MGEAEHEHLYFKCPWWPEPSRGSAGMQEAGATSQAQGRQALCCAGLNSHPESNLKRNLTCGKRYIVGKVGAAGGRRWAEVITATLTSPHREGCRVRARYAPRTQRLHTSVHFQGTKSMPAV